MGRIPDERPIDVRADVVAFVVGADVVAFATQQSQPPELDPQRRTSAQV